MDTTSKIGSWRKVSFPFRAFLVFLILTPLIATSAAIILLSYRNSIKTVDDLAGKLCSELVSDVEHRVDNFLAVAQSINKTTSYSIQQGLIDPFEIKQLSRYFWGQGQIYPGLGTMGFGNEHGEMAGANEPEKYVTVAGKVLTNGAIRRYAPDLDGGLSDTLIFEKNNYDPRQRSWYKDAVQAGKAIWAGFTVSTSSARIDLTAAAPVYSREGVLLGVSYVDLPLTQISAFLNRLEIGKSGQIFIIEKDFSIVASSFKEPPFLVEEGLRKQVSRLSAQSSQSPLISGAVKLIRNKINELETFTGERLLSGTISGKRHFVMIRPFHHEDLDLVIIVVIPESDFTEHIKKSNSMALSLVALILLVAIFFSIILANKISKPIHTLSQIAKNIGSGSWPKGDMPNSCVIEVKDLAESFKIMAWKIQESILQLKSEVEERKKAESSLQSALKLTREEQEKTKAIIAGIGDGISIQDRNYTVLYQNEIHKKFVGAHEGEFCYQAYEKNDSVCDGCPVDKSFADGMIHTAERSVSFPDGILYFSITSSPLKDADGQIIGGIEVARDVTQQKKSQQDLEEEKERLAVTLRSIGDGVITTDTVGNILLLNKKAELLTGWTQEDAIGHALAEVFHIINEKTREPLANPVDIVLQTRKIFGHMGSPLLINKNGKEHYISDSAAPIIGKDSCIIGVVLVFRDESEKIWLEQEQLKVKKLESVGVLAGGIAHDFNNILMAILGNINLALFDGDLKDSTKKLLSEAEKASLRAKDLTQQLLTFAKGGEPVRETSSLENVIKDSANFILSGDNVTCRYDIPADLWLADIDKGQISQVIQNIVLNASNSMPEGGCIHVRCENIFSTDELRLTVLPTGKYIKISIEDSGIGISAKIIEKIFDPYFSTKKGGSGLGLAISQSIIRKHGGLISVESVTGVGTTFFVYLPASKQPQERGQESVKLGNEPSKLKILIMDDEEIVQNVAKAMLIALGHEVVIAEDGAEAIKLYHEGINSGQPINLGIMDLTIPGGMGGRDAIREVLSIDANAKIIVSSGYSNDPIMANYKDYGFCAAIAKPFQLRDLSKVINKAINL